LLLIAVFGAEHKMTSALIARSTGSNPVIIRNIFTSLKRAGIISVQRGKGGARLRLEPKDITLCSVCSAVDPGALQNLIGLHPNPFPRCPVGGKITALLEVPYDMIADAVREVMGGYSLADLLAQYRAYGA
jgi:DNA-binding IscR family transcriptional regulator